MTPVSDHSLSEFTEEADDDDQPSDASDDAAEPTEPDAPAESLATARFSPDGAVCESCGASVTRRWHDDGQFVCADCKQW